MTFCTWYCLNCDTLRIRWGVSARHDNCRKGFGEKLSDNHPECAFGIDLELTLNTVSRHLNPIKNSNLGRNCWTPPSKSGGVMSWFYNPSTWETGHQLSYKMPTLLLWTRLFSPTVNATVRSRLKHPTLLCLILQFGAFVGFFSRVLDKSH